MILKDEKKQIGNWVSFLNLPFYNEIVLKNKMSKRQLSDEAKQTSLAALPTDIRLKKIDLLTSFWRRISKTEESEKDELMPLELVNMLNKFSKNVIKFDLFEQCGIYVKDKKYFDNVLLNFNERNKDDIFTFKRLKCKTGILEPVDVNINFLNNESMTSFEIYIMNGNNYEYVMVFRTYDDSYNGCKWELMIAHGGEIGYNGKNVVVRNNSIVQINIRNHRILWKFDNKLLMKHTIGKVFFCGKNHLLLQVDGYKKIIFNLQ